MLTPTEHQLRMLTPALQPLLSLTQLALAGESDIPSLVYASYLTGLPTLQALALKGLPVWTVPSLAHCTPRAHYLAQPLTSCMTLLKATISVRQSFSFL